MARWEPDARGRLQYAAVTLFLDRGYDAVTVAEIADHAGLTKRTFFNHFSDKREVLFAGSAAFEQAIVDAVRAAPRGARPVDAVTAALAAGGADLARWGEPVRQRQRIVASATELRERELIKMAALVASVATALRERGVEHLSATLVAQVCVAAFMTAFEQWAVAAASGDFPPILDGALQRIRREICHQF